MTLASGTRHQVSQILEGKDGVAYGVTPAATFTGNIAATTGILTVSGVTGNMFSGARLGGGTVPAGIFLGTQIDPTHWNTTYSAGSDVTCNRSSPVLNKLRALAGVTLGLAKTTFKSEEIRSDRMPSDTKHGTKQVSGAIPFELSDGSWDDSIEAVLCGNWDSSPYVYSASTISALAADNSINDSANGFLTPSYGRVPEPGMYMNITGFTGTVGNNQNGLKIATISAGKITFTGGTPLVDDAAGETVFVNGVASACNAGQTRRSFTMERKFSDINQNFVYTGCEYTKMQLTINATSIVKGSFDVLGQAQSIGDIPNETYNPPATSTPYDGFSGGLKEGGTDYAVITEINFTLQNGQAAQYAVGGQGVTLPPTIGRSEISGTITAYFENATLVNKFINETETSLEFTLGGGGSGYKFKMPRIKYTGGSSPNVQGEGAVTLSLPFVTELDATTGTHVIVWRNV